MTITSQDRTPYEVERSAALLMGLVNAVGDGCHHLAVAASANDATLSVSVPFHKDGEASDLDPDDALEAMEILTLAAMVGGGAVIRTHFADQTSEVRGWKLVEFYAKPLNASEIFSAYCTDAATGELIPPEWGVEYVAAPRLTV
ncbi:hypothetical protein ABZX75_28655 [Streptomyces sp. NPDC003038]|uniref:hypothetical protein n=1 Tax=unclassified Streptomyces TaxID=2593676 RepID=UPI0033B5ACD5